MDAASRQQAEREGFFNKVKIVAGLTLLSRVLGMLRDIAITSLGASRTTSAFVLAFKIPNLFRRLFGEGALSAAFVPVFSETAEKSGFERAARLFANALGLLAVTISSVVVALWLGLLVWGALFPGQWDRQLLLRLLSLMLPFTITTCLLALGSAALNCRGRFAYPAFAPILLNVFLIAAAWLVAPMWRDRLEGQLTVIAAAVTLAGAAQLVGVLWLLKRTGFSTRPRLRPVEEGIKPILKLMLPMIIGLGFLQISELLSDLIAWVFSATAHAPTIYLFGREVQRPLGEGVLMRVYAAQRLYQFPMGVLAISLGVVVFPLFSRYAARGDLPNLRESLNRAVRLAVLEGLAAGVGLFVLAEPITRLIFLHRRFTPADAASSAFILRIYVLGLWAYCTYQIFVRAFYSLKDTRTPLLISCCLVVPNLAMVAGLIWVPWLGAGAFGVATAVTFSLNAVILGVLLRRRIGPFGGRKLAFSLARSLLACAAMAGTIRLLLASLAGRADWIVVAICVPAGAAVFVLVAWLLRCPELGELLRRPSKENADL